ncbi:hypothetical protein BH11PLA2_BH11PLA2_51950 [soil metagenome]
MARDDEYVTARCINVTQPIGEFYCCVMSSSDVLSISYSDIRRIEDRDIERIVGIQRELKQTRVREIKQYVKNIDASFPTSIILSVSSRNVKYNEKAGTLAIRNKDNVAKIIDGQHRIAGLEGCESVFELIVVVFVDMDAEDQAMTFATINLAHTKVSKSLVYDLYSYQKERSPIKTCHQIARLLNKEPDSPLHHRIKILGSATGEEYQYITQATFVDKLVAYISYDPMGDRDAIKRGIELPEPPESKKGRLVFRRLFEQENDDIIADVVWTYFDAVAKKWYDAWNSREKGDILNRTLGFSALMRFLGPVYRGIRKKDGSIALSDAYDVFKKVRLSDSQLTTENYKPGTQGETKLYKELMSLSSIENSYSDDDE